MHERGTRLQHPDLASSGMKENRGSIERQSSNIQGELWGGVN